MRKQGRIVEWNDARGFGFVRWHGGDERAFAHINDFDEREVRPQVGDVVTYDVAIERGKPTATNIRYAGQSAASRHLSRRHAAQGSGRSLPGWLSSLIAMAAIVAIGWYCVDYFRRQGTTVQSEATPFSSAGAPVAANPAFRCEGKTYCSQMTCDEAVFYVRNCPGVKIDGDGDGEPCEDKCQ
jgi:cold shock CspA family protein